MIVTELYAWVVDDPTGKHGIIGWTQRDGIVMQAVSSRRDLIENVRPFAERVARDLGLPVQLRVFGSMQVLEEVKP